MLISPFYNSFMAETYITKQVDRNLFGKKEETYVSDERCKNNIKEQCGHGNIQCCYQTLQHTT
jgi:hypothetical protein